MGKLFTNEKETRRAIQAAVDKYNEIYCNHTVVKHQRSRHTKSKTQAHGNCDGIANAWVDVNMKYYDERNGNPKLQGYYNSKGKLLLGWICN